MAPTLSSSAVTAFRNQLRGWLVTPEDAGYDSARRVWNGRIDRRPALIVYCANQADVVSEYGSPGSANCWLQYAAADTTAPAPRSATGDSPSIYR